MHPPWGCQTDCPVSWHGLAHTGTGKPVEDTRLEGVPLCREPTRPRVQASLSPSLPTLTCRQRTACSYHCTRQSQDHAHLLPSPFTPCTSTNGCRCCLEIWAPLDELKTHMVASLILECGTNSALSVSLPGRCFTDDRLFRRMIESPY